ncbi:MAG TPA: hypothetical protein VHX60_08845 [Acidobacteriaceae bacterium]|nr:hypothetical protein [Acidobacteriaceae bacterium]
MILRSRPVIRTVSIFLSTLLLILSSACRRTELSASEYDVLSAWISANVAAHASEGSISKIVILGRTQSGDRELRTDRNGQPLSWQQVAKLLQSDDPALQPATIDAFRAVNVHPTALRRSIHLGVDYIVADRTQLDSIFRQKDGWGAFYRQFPGAHGFLTVSRVGFNADGGQALFWVANRCGGLCGGSAYIAMDKQNGRWVVTKIMEELMS